MNARRFLALAALAVSPSVFAPDNRLQILVSGLCGGASGNGYIRRPETYDVVRD